MWIRQAQKTDGIPTKQSNSTIRRMPIFILNPNLDIFADDVKCSHGSTIGPFDKEEIFYLRTRGVKSKRC